MLGSQTCSFIFSFSWFVVPHELKNLTEWPINVYVKMSLQGLPQALRERMPAQLRQQYVQLTENSTTEAANVEWQHQGYTR